MSHDDGKKLDDIIKSDIVLLGVSRTSKTPTSIYLANRGYKTANIPLVMDQKIPEELKSKNNKICIVGLVTDPERLADVRRNRVTMMNETNIKEYTDLKSIKEEIVKYWDLRKEIGGGVVKVRLDTKLGERMYLNWIKEKSVYLNIMYVLNVIRKERQQEYYMLTISTVGVSSLNSDMRNWMV